VAGAQGATLDVLIRPATFEDVAAMGTVWLRAALVGYEGIFPPEAPKPTAGELTERWRRALAEGRTGASLLVACHTGPDRTVVGTVAAVPDVEETTRGFVHGLYVDPGHWGRGVGRRLHDEALHHLRGCGHRVAGLWVLEANVRARAMYERWGWQLMPTRQEAYPGVDEVFYLREL
jgi:ribosomal protein S18 acetylase RimI-like enzyme